jgi:hypothetical protein
MHDDIAGWLRLPLKAELGLAVCARFPAVTSRRGHAPQ